MHNSSFFRMPLFVLTITEIRNVGYHPDTHAARVTGQIGNRDVVDVQYDDTCRVGAGVKRALGGLGSGALDRLVAADAA
jgi:hypothetical protein